MGVMERAEYARRYGATAGDRVRLGDTDLWVEVEADDVYPGDELVGGCGKTLRDGVLAAARAPRDSALDLIIPNVLVLDPVLGVRKTSVGVAGGRIVGTGRAGNPDVQAGVDLVVDSHTAIVPGEGLIATAGIVDSHVHLSSPAVTAAALSAGITTIVGMGTGGVWDVGANPAYNLRALLAGWAGVPLNAAFLARGSSRSAALLAAAVESGAGGARVSRGGRRRAPGHPGDRESPARAGLVDDADAAADAGDGGRTAADDDDSAQAARGDRF